MKNCLSMTRHGAALGGGAFALFVVGLVVGDGWLMLLGAGAWVLLAGAFVVGWLSLRNMEVRLHLPHRVSAGRAFDIEVSLHNHRVWFDGFHTEVRVKLPGKTTFEAMAGWTAAGGLSQIQQSMTLPGRGSVDLHPTQLSTSFPLGLFLVKRTWMVRHRIIVTPRPIHPRELNHDGSLHDAEPRGGVTVGQSFGDPRGIRPWQAGDSARRIHWPASARAMARGHGLRVREYDPPGFHPECCHLVFHSYASGGELLREDRFERAISLLTGALLSLQGNGIPCVLTADFNDWQDIACGTRSQLVDCLTHLASVQRHRGSEAHDLEQLLQSVSPDHALMIVSDMPPDSWVHLLAKHPHTLIIDIRQIRYRMRSFMSYSGV